MATPGKTTVEQCLTLSMKGLPQRGVLRPGASGTLTWRWTGGDTYSVGFRCEEGGEGRRLCLTYSLTDKETGERTHHHVAVNLDTDPCRYGGEQWYFRCPACARRVRNLHVPPGRDTFACRHCYDLTYAQGHRTVTAG